MATRLKCGTESNKLESFEVLQATQLRIPLFQTIMLHQLFCTLPTCTTSIALIFKNIDKRHEPNEHLSGHLYNLDKYLHCLNTVIIILSVPAVVKTIPRKFLKYKYNAVHIVLLNLSLNAAPCHTLRQLWSVHEVIMGWHYM